MKKLADKGIFLEPFDANKVGKTGEDAEGYEDFSAASELGTSVINGNQVSFSTFF